MNFQLLIKVIAGIKAVAEIEFVVILAVAAFNLAVVARSIWLN